MVYKRLSIILIVIGIVFLLLGAIKMHIFG